MPQETRGLHPMLFQCWSSVEDAGPTLKQHWVKAPCFLPSGTQLCRTKRQYMLTLQVSCYRLLVLQRRIDRHVHLSMPSMRTVPVIREPIPKIKNRLPPSPSDQSVVYVTYLNDTLVPRGDISKW